MQAVKVTLSATEKQEITKAATRLGLSLAAFLRMSALEAARK